MQRQTTADQVIVLKNSTMLRTYLEFFAHHAIDNVLELGIHQGGSLLFFGMATDVKKIVGVDHRPVTPPPDTSTKDSTFCRNPAIDAIIESRGLTNRVRPYFGCEQDDRRALEAIVLTEFADKPLDLIIDDASHQLEETRRSFDILFPRLRTGGFYIIEDWQWAHLESAEYQKGTKFGDKPALTNFIFELLVAYGGHYDLFSNITVRDWFVALQKGSYPADSTFELRSLLRMRGKSLGSI
jgi:cephalosporin hydroxylase